MNQEKELIDILLDSQEWETFECKRALAKPASFLETIVAFANSDGGTLVIGLEDAKKETGKNRLIGINEGLDNISDLIKLIDLEIDPRLIWSSYMIDILNKDNQHDKLAIFRILKSNDIHSLKKGDTFVRKGSQNIKIGGQEIIRLKYEKGSISYESESSKISSLEDLDISALNKYIEYLSGDISNPLQFMKDNGLAIKVSNQIEITRSGILLFAKNPAVTLKEKCSIKISHYFGVNPNFSGEPNFVTRPFSIEGPLYSQIEQTVDYFKSIVKSAPPRLVGAKFVSSLTIPEWVFQEAVTNAVIHRNYFIQNDIQIRFFDDRIEVESPGTYPATITPTNIRLERFARNPMIQRTLHKYEEPPNLDIGEGVDRMYRVMNQANLYEPLYSNPAHMPHSVQVILLNTVKTEYWDIVSKYLDHRGTIVNAKARELTGIADSVEMTRMFKNWVERGLIERVGEAKKSAFYRKKSQAVSEVLFSQIENRGKNNQ